MKRKMILLCLFLIFSSLMVAGNDEYETFEEFSVVVNVFSETGTAWCDIFWGEDQVKHKDFIILLNDIELKITAVSGKEYSSYEIEDEKLKLSIGENVNIEIRHLDFTPIKDSCMVPACPDEFQVDKNLLDFITGKENRITFSWNDIGADKYYVYEEIYLSTDDDKIISGLWVTGDTIVLTNENKDSEIDVDTIVYHLYGTNETGKSTDLGSVSLSVHSPEKISLSASIYDIEVSIS